MHVIVYSAVWCRDCREAKRFLEEHQIAYTEIDIELVPGAAEDVVRPAMPAECLLDRNALVMGYSGVYSSFLKHAVRQGERYGVPAHELLHRAGQRKLIGGQEDQLIDIALEIKRERDSGVATKL